MLPRSLPPVAIFSCVHGNFTALEAVINHARQRGIERFISLGDLVGYGPRPAACAALAREICEVCLMGDHERVVLDGPKGFGANSRRAVEHSQRDLASHDRSRYNRGSLRAWVATQPARLEGDYGLLVHASPREPFFQEHILIEDIGDGRGMSGEDLRAKWTDIWSRIRGICFFGHSHRPGLFLRSGTDQAKCFLPSNPNDLYKDLVHERFVRLESHAYSCSDHTMLVNVGSVGQPGDGDSRACYVEYDGRTVRWHRVDYDVEHTIREFHMCPLLAPHFAERLRTGR